MSRTLSLASDLFLWFSALTEKPVRKGARLLFRSKLHGSNLRFFDSDHYLNSPSFLQKQHYDRLRRKLFIAIEGVEPRGKNMPDADKLNIQKGVLKSLLVQRRRSFRSALALQVRLRTTGRNPAYPHSIMKNLLDLLAQPSPHLKVRRNALVYADDSQINALAVTCQNGEQRPLIDLEVCPMRDLLDPLEYVWNAQQLDDERDGLGEAHRELEQAVDYLEDIRTRENWWRSKIGDEGYSRLEQFARQRIQEPFLGRGALKVRDLAMLFNKIGGGPRSDSSKIWDEAHSSSLLRIRLSELPQRVGQSAAWKAEIKSELEKFRERWRCLIDPLLVPIALEVLVRPPPLSRQMNVHDLDNILRDYLIPRVLDALKPPSSYAGVPPTLIGLLRYEAWRLPPAPEGSTGFVSLALMTEINGHRSGISRLQSAIDRWINSLE